MCLFQKFKINSKMQHKYFSSFKFGQIEVASKDLHKKKQVTNIFTIDVNKVLVSVRVSCNNRKAGDIL